MQYGIVGYFVKRVSDVGFLISMLIMAFLVLSITWEVVNRFVMGSSSVWVTEVSGYLVAGILFMAAGNVYRENGHVGMTMLLDKLHPHSQNVARILIDAFVLIFALVISWATYDMAKLSYDLGWTSSTTLAMPLYIPQAFMPVGGVILALESARLMITRISTFSLQG